MQPALHNWYAADEAVSAFVAGAVPELLCDGQFVLLPTVVLCFITVGTSTEEPHLSSASDVIWRPQRFDYEATGDMPWLPSEVRDVWDWAQKPPRQIREHHIFLRTASNERYFYAGRDAHLGSYGDIRGGKAANFSLRERLPREVWLQLGGYPGWLVEVNHQSRRVDSNNLVGFDHLLKELLQQKFSHLCMTRYEEDALHVHTNARRGWLMYLRCPGDAGVYTKDLSYSGDPDATELFRCKCGIDLEFPTSQTLPRALALQAALEFFRAGLLPSCVHWELE